MSDENEHGLLSDIIRELFIFIVLIGLVLAAAYFLGYWDTLMHYVKIAFNDVVDFYMTIKNMITTGSVPGL